MAKKASIFKKLTKNERANIKQAKSIYSKRIRLYREGCDLLNDVIKEISTNFSNKKAEMQDVVIIALCNRIIGTSKVIYELSIRGYQFDNMILARSLYENLLVLWYVQRSASNTEKWLSGKVKLRTVKRELDLSSSKLLTGFYDLTSDYVHSNFEAFLTLIKTRKKANVVDCLIEPMCLANERNFLPNFWALVLAALSKHYKNLIQPETNTRIKELIAKVKKIETQHPSNNIQS
jgi:hypothetical protein